MTSEFISEYCIKVNIREAEETGHSSLIVESSTLFISSFATCLTIDSFCRFPKHLLCERN